MDIYLEDSNRNQINILDFKDKVLLIVNVASLCDHTHQYSQLVELKNRISNTEFEILAFPCNQFNEQEPHSIEEIRLFCDTKYNINFPLFNKVDVLGENQHPLYKYLLAHTPCNFKVNEVKWNFTKFLMDRGLKPIKRFNPSDQPLDLLGEINHYLVQR